MLIILLPSAGTDKNRPLSPFLIRIWEIRFPPEIFFISISIYVKCMSD